MGLFEIITIGFGLAMDAFAVSICKGLSVKKLKFKNVLTIALYFGIFQAIMPIIGYALGIAFSEVVEKVDHWIAFILLGFIGINMIKSSKDDEIDKKNDKIDFKTMVLLAIATSIDALAIGVTFAFLNANIIQAVSIIGVVTFGISIGGVVIGNKFGNKLQEKAELLGGIVLIFIGLKILLQHLNLM